LACDGGWAEDGGDRGADGAGQHCPGLAGKIPVEVEHHAGVSGEGRAGGQVEHRHGDQFAA
jgi:hypothetical protein